MSDKAKPFTAEQRVIHEKHFQVYEVCGSTKPVPKAYHIKVMRRYEATVRQLEKGLAAVTRERDVWKAERKEAVEAGQAMVARVKKERDALRQERDELLDELEGAYEAHEELRYDAAVTAERDATLRALEAELVTVRNEKHTALRERDHWITRLHVEQEKHTDTDAARTKWLFKAAELERERDAYKAFFDVWRGRNEAKRVAEIYEIYMGKPEWASALKAIADLEAIRLEASPRPLVSSPTRGTVSRARPRYGG